MGRGERLMTREKKQGSGAAGAAKAARQTKKRHKPEWASGLKHIYDSVVDEPMPDSFANLLAQLDDEDK